MFIPFSYAPHIPVVIDLIPSAYWPPVPLPINSFRCPSYLTTGTINVLIGDRYGSEDPDIERLIG